MMTDFVERCNELLALIPEDRRQAAADLLAQYGPKFFDLAREDAWGYMRRLLAGDLEAASELDAKLSDDEFIAKVKANTARWDTVVSYNVVRESLKNDFLLKLAPVVLSMLLALVGL